MWWLSRSARCVLQRSRYVEKGYQFAISQQKSYARPYASGIGADLSRHRNRRRMSSDEVSKAQAAANSASTSSKPTIFARILKREIPADIIHEDDKVIY